MSDRRAIAGSETNLNWPESSARPPEVERIRVTASAETDVRAAILRDPLSARSAAFRVLRHRIARAADPRVILVTSARDEEGKTTCALNLALVLAESGRNRVVLVEANTQTPVLTSLLGYTTPACVLDQLTQHRSDPSRPWKVAQITSHDLDVLAAHPGSESRLPLHAPSLLVAVASLRKLYDYVVIDTSSILTGLDVPLVQDAADGIVLAARTRHTRARSLNAALDQIGHDRILGVVLVDP
jgi:polysaccharide biosynthesis transport protein